MLFCLKENKIDYFTSKLKPKIHQKALKNNDNRSSD